MNDAWPRFARFDAPRLAERLAEEKGVRLTIDGPCPGGEIGAAYVSWPDGRRSVLTTGSAHAGPLLDLARAAGLPVPVYELVAHLDNTTIIVQQRLPGTPPTTVDAALVDQLATITDHFTALLADHRDPTAANHFPTTNAPAAPDHLLTTDRLDPATPDHLLTTGNLDPAAPDHLLTTDSLDPAAPDLLPITGHHPDPAAPDLFLTNDRPRPATPDLFLTTDGPGFCLHQPLAAHSRRTARLLDRIHEIGATAPPMTGDDLVHLDFHPGNILVADGHVTGIIDWDGAARGDRHFDLVTLQFNLAGSATPHLAARLNDRLNTIDQGRLHSYRAHMALRQVDWSIRHHDQSTVDHWLAVAETTLP